jgi:hypothetical protein
MSYSEKEGVFPDFCSKIHGQSIRLINFFPSTSSRNLLIAFNLLNVRKNEIISSEKMKKLHFLKHVILKSDFSYFWFH